MENETFAWQGSGSEGEMPSEHGPFRVDLLDLVCPFYSPERLGHLLFIEDGSRRSSPGLEQLSIWKKRSCPQSLGREHRVEEPVPET